MKGKRRTILIIAGVLINLGVAKFFKIPTETAIWMIVIEAVIVAFVADWIYKHYR